MRRLASGLIVYTESEAASLRAVHTEVAITAAVNALYRQSDLGRPRPGALVTDLVCVGRLAATKRPELLLDAFIEASPHLPREVRLLFIGDGPLRGWIEQRVLAEGLEDRVLLRGHVSDVEAVRDVFERAIASVAPGEAGLSIIQSLGFGVPMILADGARHGPEIEAARPDENVVLFRSGSTDALARAMLDVVAERDVWLARRSRIAAAAHQRYSIEATATSFIAGLYPAAANDGAR